MTGCEGKCLIDELAAQSGKNVLIGVRSSFFFIGPAEEAIADMHLVGLLARFCVAFASNKRVSKNSLRKAEMSEDIGKRKVLRTYVRDPAGNEDDVVIIVDGKEFGAFWTRDEYLDGRKALIEALGKC